MERPRAMGHYKELFAKFICSAGCLWMFPSLVFSAAYRIEVGAPPAARKTCRVQELPRPRARVTSGVTTGERLSPRPLLSIQHPPLFYPAQK